MNTLFNYLKNSCQFLLITVVMIWLLSISAAAQTTAFTYQGRLTDAGNPANGNYDMQFKLFDTLTVGTGTQQGATINNPTVAVSTGSFNVTLDFGTNVFTGAARYLEIGVRPAGSPNPYTVLEPRQTILSTPYAIQSISAVGANGTFSFAGIAPPAVAPAGQGRLYFDTTTNKLKVSESGGAFVNLVGASGVSGSGTTNTIPLWSAGTTLGNSLISQSAGNVGVGLSNPTNGQLHVLSSTVGVPAIYGESATSRGVWGKSVSSRGVYGESSNAEGVYGVSSSGSGIYGESAATNTVTFSGVAGRATGSGGAAVAGLATGSGAFGVYGESATGRAVYGKSVSSRGVYGESTNGEGVFGISNTATGVFGISTSASGVGGYFQNNAGGTALKVDGSGAIIFSGTGNVGIGTATPTLGRLHVVAPVSTTGVYGESAAAHTITNPGVYGRSTGDGGIGVIGEANTGNTRGVYGTTTSASASSTGVYGKATSGYAIYADGNAGQARDKGGWVKAMLHVTYYSLESGILPTIDRCFVSTPSSGNNCDISVAHYGSFVDIDFPFEVEDRFISLTPLNGETIDSMNFSTVHLLADVQGGSFYIFVF